MLNKLLDLLKCTDLNLYTYLQNKDLGFTQNRFYYQCPFQFDVKRHKIKIQLS